MTTESAESAESAELEASARPTPEELEATLEAYMLVIYEPLAAFVASCGPLLERWAEEIGCVVQSINDLVTALQQERAAPTDRPGWQSSHGPAHRRRK